MGGCSFNFELYCSLFIGLEFWEDFTKLRRFSSNDPRDAFFFDFIAEKLSGAFKPQQRRKKFIGLLRVFKENNPSCVMEIYTAEGGSLFCFCKLARNNAKIQLIYHF